MLIHGVIPFSHQYEGYNKLFFEKETTQKSGELLSLGFWNDLKLKKPI